MNLKQEKIIGLMEKEDTTDMEYAVREIEILKQKISERLVSVPFSLESVNFDIRVSLQRLEKIQKRLEISRIKYELIIELSEEN